MEFLIGQKGDKLEMINKSIDHTFTYKQLSEWLNGIYQNHKHGFKLDIGLGYVLYNPIQNECTFMSLITICYLKKPLLLTLKVI